MSKLKTLKFKSCKFTAKFQTFLSPKNVTKKMTEKYQNKTGTNNTLVYINKQKMHTSHTEYLKKSRKFVKNTCMKTVP